jgi:hypothetical protein
MKAVFIWKADSTFESKSKFKFIRGPTWWVEDFNSKSNSIEIISGKPLNNTTMFYLVENKPVDWIGEDFLEALELPHRYIDHWNTNGVLEQIGDWYKWTSASSISNMDEALALVVKLNLPGFSPGKKE